MHGARQVTGTVGFACGLRNERALSGTCLRHFRRMKWQMKPLPSWSGKGLLCRGSRIT